MSVFPTHIQLARCTKMPKANTQYNEKCNKHNFDLFKVPNEKTIEFKATKRKQTFALSENLSMERTQQREVT